MIPDHDNDIFWAMRQEKIPVQIQNQRGYIRPPKKINKWAHLTDSDLLMHLVETQRDMQSCGEEAIMLASRAQEIMAEYDRRNGV